MPQFKAAFGTHSWRDLVVKLAQCWTFVACRGPKGWTPSYAFANCYAKGSDSVGAHTGKVVLTAQCRTPARMLAALSWLVSACLLVHIVVCLCF